MKKKFKKKLKKMKIMKKNEIFRIRVRCEHHHDVQCIRVGCIRVWFIRMRCIQKTKRHYPIIALLRGSHGLSARRSWRTLSSRPEGPKAGQKGRNLEVGARRAPRLLVMYISCFVANTYSGTLHIYDIQLRRISTKKFNYLTTDFAPCA